MNASHIVREPGDTRSVCGIKNPFPRVAKKSVRAHRDGRGDSFVVCPDCEEAA